MTETVLTKNKEIWSNTNKSGNFNDVHKSTCHSRIIPKEHSVLKLAIAAEIDTHVRQKK
jgi:hypothetical protein